MEKFRSILLLFLFYCAALTAQDARKMSKNLKVTTTELYNKTVSISFERCNPNKHGFEDISLMFKNSFISHKFNVIDSSQYLLVMDYDYGYSIPNYRMQYSNFKAQILDLTNNSNIVATIVYKGRFEIDAVADAVAVELSNSKVPENIATTKSKSTVTVPGFKTKEERLTELKGLYEKQLITKEEYEEAKKKILAD